MYTHCYIMSMEQIPAHNITSILVVNALNGVLPLQLRKSYPSAKITCAEVFSFYKDHLERIGFEVVDWENFSDMKFDLVIGNPPYLKGKWIDFIQKAVELSSHTVMLVSPDGTNNFSSRSSSLTDLLLTSGLQNKIDCTHWFPDINSGKIVCYVLHVNKPGNPSALTDSSILGQIFNKVTNLNSDKLSAILSSKRSKEFSKSARYEKMAKGRIPIIESVTKTGAVWSHIDRQNACIVDASQYWLTNRYYGKDTTATLIEVSGEVAISTNILAIKRLDGFTKEDFNNVYLQPLFRITLDYLRKGGFDTSPRHLAQLPVTKKTENSLYKLLKLTDDEIKFIQDYGNSSSK